MIDTEREEHYARQEAAAAELEAWHNLPKGLYRRQALEALVAKYPTNIKVEYLADNSGARIQFVEVYV